MGENIRDFIEKTAVDGDVFFQDVDIICRILDTVEISFPPERSYSFKINADWYLNELSRKRSSAVAARSQNRELISNADSLAYAGSSDWGHTSTSWEEVLSLGIFGIAERVFEKERKAKGEEKATIKPSRESSDRFFRSSKEVLKRLNLAAERSFRRIFLK